MSETCETSGKSATGRHEVRSSGLEVSESTNFWLRTVVHLTRHASLAPRACRAPIDSGPCARYFLGHATPSNY